MLWVILAAIYVIGAVSIFALDGWFDWTNNMYDDDRIAFFLLWPITIWYGLAKALRNVVEEAKINHDKKVEEQIKIRVQAEKELAASMRLLEEEFEEESPKKRSRRSR